MSQSDSRPKSPDLNLRNFWSTLTIGTNQEPTHNPSKESDQSDILLPRNPFFHIYSLYKQCNPKPRAPSYSHCVGIGGSPSSSLVIKLSFFCTGYQLPGGHWEILQLGHNTSWRLAGGYSFCPLLISTSELSLSPLYFDETLLQKRSERSSLVSDSRLNSSPSEANSPSVFSFNNNLSPWEFFWVPSGQGKDAWSSSSLLS